jgi:hypothetical protein
VTLWNNYFSTFYFLFFTVRFADKKALVAGAGQAYIFPLWQKSFSVNEN